MTDGAPGPESDRVAYSNRPVHVPGRIQFETAMKSLISLF